MIYIRKGKGEGGTAERPRRKGKGATMHDVEANELHNSLSIRRSARPRAIPGSPAAH